MTERPKTSNQPTRKMTPQQLSFTGQLFVEETGISAEEHIQILQEQALADNKERNRLRQIIRFQKHAYRLLKEYVIACAQGEVQTYAEQRTKAMQVLAETKKIEERAQAFVKYEKGK